MLLTVNDRPILSDSPVPWGVCIMLLFKVPPEATAPSKSRSLNFSSIFLGVLKVVLLGFCIL